jgi:integrase
VILFAVETAMRRGEIAGLTWGGVDLVRRTAGLDETKNGEQRMVPLSSRAVEIWRDLQTPGTQALSSAYRLPTLLATGFVARVEPQGPRACAAPP